MKIIHVAVELDTLIRMAQGDSPVLKHTDGRPMPNSEAITHAVILKAKGFEVFPPCENYCRRSGHCLGHPQVDNAMDEALK